MKKLTKIRLINWHYFANETINVKNNMLITGQNATGKSTIVDAVAFILTAGDQIFNLAANEKSKRDLRGYVKCKLGIDNQEYLRSGDTTGHVALEFFDERTSKFFTVGAVIDVFGEITPPKVLFYAADRKIGDDLFIDAEHRILTTLNFKKAKLAEDIYLTRREAKLAFRSKFGSINETYFSLLPKALAFKPIGDVKEFIYHYLLEEKTLDVESIKESIHSYRDLEGTLKVIKAKIADLQDMKGTFEEIQKNQETKRFYEYLLKVIDLENNRHQILAKNQWVEKLGISSERFKKDIAELDRQIEAADDRGKEIYALLQSDESFKAGQVFDRDISNKTTLIEDQKENDYADVAAMLEKCHLLAEAGYRPYYLYRQKNTLQNLENVGWCKPGHEGYYNIYIMEEVQTILSAGAGGSTKLVADGGKRMQRIFNFKYPTEYIQRFDEVLERKKGVAVFYDHDLGTETSG